MKSSRKGMKLNNVRFFRQPRPRSRRQITKIRLLPTFPGHDESIVSSIKDRQYSSNYSENSEKSGNRCFILDRNQRSKEIAWISHTDDSLNSQDSLDFEKRSWKRYRDSFSETDPENKFINNNRVELSSIINSVPGVVEEKELEEKRRNVEMNVKEEKMNVSMKPEERVDREDRHDELKNRESEDNDFQNDKSILWQYGNFQRILNFFGFLFGKRRNGNIDKEFSITGQRLVETIGKHSLHEGRDEKSDSTIKNPIKRLPNGKNVATVKKLTIEQPDDQIFTNLTKKTKQIHKKQLEMPLMKNAITTRICEKESRRYKKVLQEKLKTRQMSSPLH